MQFSRGSIRVPSGFYEGFWKGPIDRRVLEGVLRGLYTLDGSVRVFERGLFG